MGRIPRKDELDYYLSLYFVLSKDYNNLPYNEEKEYLIHGKTFHVTKLEDGSLSVRECGKVECIEIKGVIDYETRI